MLHSVKFQARTRSCFGDTILVVAPGFVQRLARVREFHLLEALGDHDRYIQSAESLFCHVGLLLESCSALSPALIDAGLRLFAAVLRQRGIIRVSLLAAA